jgi:aspartyl-tRNA synthetase
MEPTVALDFLGSLRRTHTCGELRAADAGREVVLMGWVHKRRDHGGVIFVDLRDRDGITQVCFHEDVERTVHQRAEEVRPEYVIAVEGKVALRAENAINPKMVTGEIEIVASRIWILNDSRTAPFPMEEQVDVSEDVRLKYRYVDLRRPHMQRNIILRSKVSFAVREFLNSAGFLEIETPFMTRSTPEGARDYLVPSRVQPGSFYALPQSPQIFKQLLMVSGYEKYFQIVRCFRDEDLRADRQPEFTQLDVEMSFVAEADVMGLIEGMLIALLQATTTKRIKQTPFPHIAFEESMRRYGNDHPDLRFELPLVELGELARLGSFKVFQDSVEHGGMVKGLRVPGRAAVTRKELDALTEWAKGLGAKGLVSLALLPEGPRSPLTRFMSEDELAQVVAHMEGQPGDLMLFVADEVKVCNDVLSRLRVRTAEELGLIDPDEVALCWVVDFPLLEWIEEDGKGRYHATHNPFSNMRPGDEPLLDSEPLKATARQYDIVCNGFEVGGGSVRINVPELQRKVFGLLGLSDEQIDEQFGHMLEAFEYGAPPHGGIALGIDRLVMLLAGNENIRDVIAFPKMQNGRDALMGAPSPVVEEQLKELHLRVRE